jgi:uncharacterized protein with HEPN domain
MPHSAPVLLEDVRHASQRIIDFTTSRSLDDYQKDEMLRAAVERFFIIIGEALGRLEKVDPIMIQTIAEYRKIIGFRNVLVHGYELIDDSIVWQTIQVHLPILKQQVESLLAASGPP